MYALTYDSRCGTLSSTNGAIFWRISNLNEVYFKIYKNGSYLGQTSDYKYSISGADSSSNTWKVDAYNSTMNYQSTISITFSFPHCGKNYIDFTSSQTIIENCSTVKNRIVILDGYLGTNFIEQNADYRFVEESVDGGAYSNRHTNTGKTQSWIYDFSTTDCNHIYSYRSGYHRDGVDYICSDNEWSTNTLYVQNLVGIATSYSAVDLSWTNFNEVINHTPQIYSGGTWHDFNTVTGTSTTYSITGLTSNTTHQFRIKSSGCTGIVYSAEINVYTPEIPTFSGFTSNGTMIIPTGFTYMDYLIIGGGGASGGALLGSNAQGGGGGAGGFLTGRIINPVAGSYSVVVGAGGTTNLWQGNNGSNSSFYGFTAKGGGRGGLGENGGLSWYSLSGGSGGGGGVYNAYISSGSTGAAGQGNSGAAGKSVSIHGGGGGGALAASTTNLGGSGRTSSITGSAVIYAKGGDGGSASGNQAGTAGAANTGNGANGATSKGVQTNPAAGGSGVVYVKLFNILDPIPLAPTGGTAVSITCNEATLQWVNNNVSGVTGNTVKIYSGATWVTIDTIASGDTTYALTGLTPNLQYKYRICPFNLSYETCSADITFSTLNPAPYNLTDTSGSGFATIDWDLNDPSFGIGIIPQIRLSGATDWTVKPVIATTAVTYTFTGLTFNTDYQCRFIRITDDTQYASAIHDFSTPNFIPPSGLTATNVSATRIPITWVNNDTYDNLWFYINGVGTLISNTATGYTFTGLYPNTNYVIYIRAEKQSVFGNSTSITQRTIGFLSPFCEGGDYTTTGSTCGNEEGIVEITDKIYMELYDFILTDLTGGTHAFNTNYLSAIYGQATGLTANWYDLTATPKALYYSNYGSNPCTIERIGIEDTNTTITLVETKIKNAVCGGFGNRVGRIVYRFSDTTGTAWSFTLYNQRQELVNQQTITGTTLTGVTNIVYQCAPDTYYGIVENNNGCTYLIDLTLVDADKLWTVEGIRRVFLTPWDATIEYNYYDSTSEDWYVAGLDTQQFTSTKIAEFVNLPDFWYEIKLNTATMTYAQGLQRGQNGLTYNEAINITIPHADNSKWKELTNVLTQKYIVVFQDNNDNWWVCFYRNGAEVKSYRLAENQYTLSFVHPSVDKMLTAIDYNYVKLNIL